MEPHIFQPGDPCVVKDGIFTWGKGNNHFVVPPKGRATFHKYHNEFAFVEYHGAKRELRSTRSSNLLPKVCMIEEKELKFGDLFLVNNEKRKYMGKDKDNAHKFYNDKLELQLVSQDDLWLTSIQHYIAPAKQSTLF